MLRASEQRSPTLESVVRRDICGDAAVTHRLQCTRNSVLCSSKLFPKSTSFLVPFRLRVSGESEAGAAVLRVRLEGVATGTEFALTIFFTRFRRNIAPLS